MTAVTSYDILLIDDNNEISENIASILELANYSVRYAPDGKTGIEMAHQRKPDLIICDIMMPQLDGFGVLHIIRKNPETASIPFVFLTAKADTSDFRVGMNLGADDYVIKPFEAMELLKMVEVRLKRAEMQKYSRNANGHITFNDNKENRELQLLLENRPVRAMKKKDIVFLQGQTPGDLFYVIDGKIKTSRLNPDGKELITGIHHTGHFFGYVALLENVCYRENAEVLEDARIATIPKAEFLNLMYTSQEISHRFVRTLSNDLIEMESRLLDVAYQSVRQRAANVLLRLSDMTDPKDDLITLPRKDMSSIVGTAPESLNRTLADFKDEGVISVSAEGIRILNKAKLEKILR